MAEAPSPEKTQAEKSSPPGKLPFFRLGITGVFMGLANLVPGVSGGTMVLALGLYEEFIGAFSDLTRLRFSKRAIIVVAMLFGISALTIFTLAEGIQFLMETFLPGMLALFIGMTLGGVPALYKELRPVRPASAGFAALAFLLMGLIAFVLRPDTTNPGWMLFFLGGIVGSSAMILPGISGSYMLLILGLYLPVLGGISAFKDALKSQDMTALFEVGFSIILPVGLGLVIGLAVLSNLLRFVLARYHKPAIGFLMGLLLGSVLGLYPFKETRFDKLPRYAHEGRLTVLGFGWQLDEDAVIVDNLKQLEREDLKLRLVPSAPEKEPTPADVERAVQEKAIILAYDSPVPKEVRRLAEKKDVELMLVPNTEFTPLKGVLCLALIPLGFLLTFLLSRLDRKSKA